MVFAIRQHESAIEIHVSSPPEHPPPRRLPPARALALVPSVIHQTLTGSLFHT